MISKIEAIDIGRQYIGRNKILKESCNDFMTSDSPVPKYYIVEILYENEDGDIFRTYLQILINGIVSIWNTSYIKNIDDE